MKITTIGEILIDMTQTGTDANGNAVFAATPGGAPANVAVAVRKLGVESAFVGCVGSDPFGAILRNTLLQYGVDASGLQVTDHADTTLAVSMRTASAALRSAANPARTRRSIVRVRWKRCRIRTSCISAAYR